MTTTVFLIALGAVLAWAIYVYNRLVSRKNHVLEAWSGIDVQLKRRHDLIPKLVETVKAYGRYEQDVMSKLTQMRAALGTRAPLAERAAAETEISGMLKGLIAVAEAYPDLKASESFLSLQANLTEVEEQIQYARRYFNGTVRELNVLIQSFPSNLIARVFRFIEAEYFEIPLAAERASPEMKLQ